MGFLCNILLKMCTVVSFVVSIGCVVPIWSSQEEKQRVCEFHTAVEQGNYTNVQRCIKKGIDVNSLGGIFRETALYKAIKNNDNKMMQLLIDARADIQAVEGDNTILSLAIFLGLNDDVLRVLINARARVNGLYDEMAPLHIASDFNRVELVHYLIMHNANVDAVNQYGYTALLLAANQGYHEVVKVLLAAQATINATNKDGFAPLQLAVCSGSINTVKTLLLARANVNAVNKRGVNALHTASIRNYPKIVKALLVNKADINVVDPSGRTPLQIAEKNGYGKVVKILMAS